MANQMYVIRCTLLKKKILKNQILFLTEQHSTINLHQKKKKKQRPWGRGRQWLNKTHLFKSSFKFFLKLSLNCFNMNSEDFECSQAKICLIFCLFSEVIRGSSNATYVCSSQQGKSYGRHYENNYINLPVPGCLEIMALANTVPSSFETEIRTS